MKELTDYISFVWHVRNPHTGNTIEINLTPRENKYLYYQAGDWQFCYTPHADREGWYYSFVYQPVGKGSRTGRATRWTLRKLRAHRKRKDAKARALSLHRKKKGE